MRFQSPGDFFSTTAFVLVVSGAYYGIVVGFHQIGGMQLVHWGLGIPGLLFFIKYGLQPIIEFMQWAIGGFFAGIYNMLG